MHTVFYEKCTLVKNIFHRNLGLLFSPLWHRHPYGHKYNQGDNREKQSPHGAQGKCEPEYVFVAFGQEWDKPQYCREHCQEDRNDSMVKGPDIKFAATISFQSGLTGVFVYKIDSGIHCNPGEHYQRCESSLVESETSNCKDKKYAYERYWNKT